SSLPARVSWAWGRRLTSPDSRGDASPKFGIIPRGRCGRTSYKIPARIMLAGARCMRGKEETMAVAERRADVTWQGNLTQGQGVASLASGVLTETPVTWAARTQSPDGKTSPEELIAAAHAACYAMAFSNTLDKAGSPPERL